jgi:hypothetical protein
MSPEKASAHLTEWINDGRMDSVVQLLQNIEPRTVSRILEGMDSGLVTELLEAYQKTNAPPPTMKR